MYLLEYAVGLAGVDNSIENGPQIIKQSAYMLKMDNIFKWLPAIKYSADFSVEKTIAIACDQLAKQAENLALKKEFFTVLGGDHTSAIGTWSGVHHAYRHQGDIGLIWLDAHMDSHTPQTTESGRIHGMPLACLLGYGYETLVSILSEEPKLKPENLCLIGVRSFESGEAELLKQLNVRVYHMDEVNDRGLLTVFNEAISIVKKHTVVYGISIDMDCFDPLEIPGVGVPEPYGLHVSELNKILKKISCDRQFIAAEIVEFNPSKDIKKKTEKTIVNFLKIIAHHKGNI